MQNDYRVLRPNVISFLNPPDMSEKNVIVMEIHLNVCLNWHIFELGALFYILPLNQAC